jgi:glyoxylase-like metal-dependent hydrolase (beta-lactamase superfamily II)
LHFEWVKSFLVLGNDRAALIDTGAGIGNIRAVVDELTSLPVSVINSHGHWDHIGSNYLFDDIAIHESEAWKLEKGVSRERMRDNLAPDLLNGPLPLAVDAGNAAIPPSKATTNLHGGESIDLGGVVLEVIHAPGHSPGSVVFLDRARRILFSTDVAYGAPLYCYSPETNFDDYRISMRQLAALAPELRIIYPSHNESPMSPDLLVSIDKGFDRIVAREAEVLIETEYRRYDFDGFSVFLSL